MLSRYGLELVERRRLGGFWYLMGALMPIYMEKLPLMRSLGYLVRNWFRALHLLESAALRLMKKDVEVARAAWTVTYILVVRRPIPA